MQTKRVDLIDKKKIRERESKAPRFFIISVIAEANSN